MISARPPRSTSASAYDASRSSASSDSCVATVQPNDSIQSRTFAYWFARPGSSSGRSA